MINNKEDAACIFGERIDLAASLTGLFIVRAQKIRKKYSLMFCFVIRIKAKA